MHPNTSLQAQTKAKHSTIAWCRIIATCIVKLPFHVCILHTNAVTCNPTAATQQTTTLYVVHNDIRICSHDITRNPFAHPMHWSNEVHITLHLTLHWCQIIPMHYSSFQWCTATTNKGATQCINQPKLISSMTDCTQLLQRSVQNVPIRMCMQHTNDVTVNLQQCSRQRTTLVITWSP
jgi:hypothetical protein